ncbi:hypothetical protein [Streptomyces sp. KN37]|uniref:hypothetical protein n=1 Tax=Streptomyces sp. KN37 TaxID=3090667 RepID=UPI002A74D90B|nr:hypothetical protein [Streptomyces sp. KN37]WPO74017.1 hypothetical protein R9806_27055 [Streptomyces sp. KN37]
MPDVTVKLSDGVREITVENHGSNDNALAHAEATALRLYEAALARFPAGQRTGFTGWALSSDTERSPEE